MPERRSNVAHAELSFDEPRVKMNDCAVAQVQARDREVNTKPCDSPEHDARQQGEAEPRCPDTELRDMRKATAPAEEVSRRGEGHGENQRERHPLQCFGSPTESGPGAHQSEAELISGDFDCEVSVIPREKRRCILPPCDLDICDDQEQSARCSRKRDEQPRVPFPEAWHPKPESDGKEKESELQRNLRTLAGRPVFEDEVDSLQSSLNSVAPGRATLATPRVILWHSKGVGMSRRLRRAAARRARTGSAEALLAFCVASAWFGCGGPRQEDEYLAMPASSFAGLKAGLTCSAVFVAGRALEDVKVDELGGLPAAAARARRSPSRTCCT